MHEPVGVVAHVSAWNYPAFGRECVAPALLAGNAGKAERASLRRASARERSQQSTFHRRVSGVSRWTRRGRALVTQNGCRRFTGSREAGTEVAAVAARSHTRAILELGGVDGAYVRRDVADLERAAASVASGAYYNAGQGCCAIERVYVHRDVYESFVEALVSEAAKLCAATRRMKRRRVRCVAEALRRVEAHVNDAVRSGASVFFRGKAPAKGYFHPAMVVGGDALRGSQRASLMTRAESFAPVAAVIPVHDDEEAIEAMNDTSYGLTASVYTSTVPRPSPYRPPGRRHWVLERLQRSVGQLALDW